MKHLTANVNSKYLEAADKLLPGKRRGRIVAYVESYEDVSFWRLLLDEFETSDHWFQIMLPTHGGLTKGKKPAISSCIDNNAFGTRMIACVDSDYDWLMDGLTGSSRLLISSPFVIHTYTYAIENYQCWAKSLHQICVQCTLNDRMPFDIEAFMTMYSETVWPLFVWNVWFYRNRLHQQYSMQDLNMDTHLAKVNVQNPMQAIQNVREKTDRKVRRFEQTMPQAVLEVRELEKDLIFKGVTPQLTYLFMHGHHLVENVVMKLLEPVCTQLKNEREVEIRHMARHEQQYRNEISAYRHSQMDLAEAIRKNTHYRDCPMYSRMRQDLRNFLIMLPERGGEKQQDGKDLKSSDQHQ